MECKKIQYAEDFIQLLMQNQMRIYAFILGLVRNYQDADDILQDTIHVMWVKFADHQPINDFAAWANQIAYYKILNFRQKRSGKFHLQCEDRLFEQLVPAARESSAYSETQMEKLKTCLQKLSERDYQLVDLRYYQNYKPKKIASLLGLSIVNIYKSMSRVHGRLLNCIENSKQA